jgi:hypothetical protein
MKNLLIFSLLLLSFSLFSQNNKTKDELFLEGKEILIQDLGVNEDGNQIYRCYNKDGYLDYMITSKGDVNGFIHLYDYTGVDSVYAQFEVPGANFTKTVFFLKKESLSKSLAKAENGDGTLGFGILNAKEYNRFTRSYLDSGIFCSYVKNGKEYRMYCGVEYK